MRWEIIYGFYCKFPFLSSGKRILKIGWDLTKLPPWVSAYGHRLLLSIQLCLHPFIFLQRCTWNLKPAVPISFFRSPFHVFFGRPLFLWPCVRYHRSACFAILSSFLLSQASSAFFFARLVEFLINFSPKIKSHHIKSTVDLQRWRISLYSLVWSLELATIGMKSATRTFSTSAWRRTLYSRRR